MTASRSEKSRLEQPGAAAPSYEAEQTTPTAASSSNAFASGADAPPVYENYNTGIDSQLSLQGEDALDEAPPAYSDSVGHIQMEENGVNTDAVVADDGRININISEKGARRLSYMLGPALRSQLQAAIDQEGPPPPPYVPVELGGEPGKPPPPPMNVVIHVVGSRGDVQPFVALGKVLKDTYRHRVRLATHPTFQKFVEENGLEFFSIGGDPSELMAFMVKNPGLMPGFDTLRSGDVGRRRKQISQMIKGCWRSCIETSNGLTVEPYPGAWSENDSNVPEGHLRPFVADAIIANPPSFAHVHCAEKLGIPLHIMFTMPWSPTQAFPHPLANIQSTNTDENMSFFMSYLLVDMMTWQGLGDVINRFRIHTLGLDELSRIWAPGMLTRLRIPHTYCWSPALIAKPRDWPQHVHISGFYFLNLASNFAPEPDLQEFLDAGPPPVYIGFGSIVVDDPNAMTQLIFEAVKKTGQRALVSKGWGGFGAEALGKPDEVFMLGNVPHDWLFKRVSCTVIHGGAGTVSASLLAGCPTVVVPFFGDQPFWGSMIARAGAGPVPIPHKQLTSENLAEAILQALEPNAKAKAQEISDKIKSEKGCDIGAQSFHQFLRYDELRCSLIPSKVAVWRIKRTSIRLSSLAATVLANEGLLAFSDLKLYRSREYNTDEGPWDPISGATSALMGTASSVLMGVADYPIETLKLLHIHPDSNKKKSKSEQTGGSSSSNSLQQSSAENTSRTSLSSPPPSSSGHRPSQSLHERGSIASMSTANDSIRHVPSRGSDTSSLRSPQPSISGASANAPIVVDPNTNILAPGNAPIIMEQLAEVQSVPSTNSQSSPPPSASQSSLARALQEAQGSSRRHSRSPSRSSQSHCTFSRHDTRDSNKGKEKEASAMSDMDPAHAMEVANDTRKGVMRIVGASLRSPMDFSLAISKGFHNIPKLYGEEVRQVERVTDINSGIKTAAKEFGLGMFDGISGLVTQPVKGAQKEGFVGFAKGFGRGIGGIIVKPAAGMWAIPAYLHKGVYQQLHSQHGSTIQTSLLTSRITEGYAAYELSTEEERREVLAQWATVKRNMKKKMAPGEESFEALQTRIKLHDERKRQEKEGRVAERNRKKLDKLQAKQEKKMNSKKVKKEKKKKKNLASSSNPDLPELVQSPPPIESTASPAPQAYQPASPEPYVVSPINRDFPHRQDTVSSTSSQPAAYGTVSSMSSLSADPSAQNDTPPPGGAVELPPSYEPPPVVAELPADPHDPPPPFTEKDGMQTGVYPVEKRDPAYDAEMEEAIRLSIAQTSRGDAEEDALIERAIRASAAELERARASAPGVEHTEEQEQEAIQRAINASIAEAQRDRETKSKGQAGEGEDEYARQLEEALRASMLETRHRAPRHTNLAAGPSSAKHMHKHKVKATNVGSTSDDEHDSWESSAASTPDASDDESDLESEFDSDDSDNSALRAAIEASKLESLPTPPDYGDQPPSYSHPPTGFVSDTKTPEPGTPTDVPAPLKITKSPKSPDQLNGREGEGSSGPSAGVNVSGDAPEGRSASLSADDQELQKALNASLAAQSEPASQPNVQQQEEEEKALQDALNASRTEEAEAEKARQEEEIVLAYIKKQSLMEEQHRRQMMGVVEAAERQGEASGAGGS